MRFASYLTLGAVLRLTVSFVILCAGVGAIVLAEAALLGVA